MNFYGKAVNDALMLDQRMSNIQSITFLKKTLTLQQSSIKNIKLSLYFKFGINIFTTCRYNDYIFC